jgi:hypothetical protein
MVKRCGPVCRGGESTGALVRTILKAYLEIMITFTTPAFILILFTAMLVGAGICAWLIMFKFTK